MLNVEGPSSLFMSLIFSYGVSVSQSLILWIPHLIQDKEKSIFLLMIFRASEYQMKKFQQIFVLSEYYSLDGLV